MPEDRDLADALDETASLDGTELGSPARDEEGRPARRGAVPLVALMVACVVTAGVMLLGEGVLWEAAGVPEPAPASSGQTDVDLDPTDDADTTGQPETGATDYADELLATYEASSTSSDAAWAANVRLAANALNGAVIPAGESLSFDDTIGETTSERGYQEAAVMLGNVATTVVGGGVSQVSTALYIAALRAGLTVEERHANVVAVDYAEMGMDAAVSSDGQDLVIRNNTSYPVRVEVAVEGASVTVSLYGVPYDPHTTREVTSRVVDMYARPASEVYDDPTAQGLLPSDSVRFYVAEVHVATYRDGQQESNVLVSSDTYQVVDEQVAPTVES